jgi:predicted dehydrogenase
MDSAEAAKLARAAAASTGVTGVCFNYRHFPLVQQARTMIGSGAYGPAHFVVGSYLQDWLLHREDWNWRLESAKAGPTRAMGDIGSHWVDTVEHVLGTRVKEVTADLGRLHEERLRPAGEVETFARSDGAAVPVPMDTEDFGSVLLRFDNGVRGGFSVSQVSPGRKNRLSFQVDAAEASFAWDQENPNDLWVGRRDEPNSDVPRDPSLLDPPAARLAHYPGGHQEGWPDALRNLFIDFYAAVDAHRRGATYEPTFASFDDARHVVQVIEAIARSDEARSWTPVPGLASMPEPARKRAKEVAP